MDYPAITSRQAGRQAGIYIITTPISAFLNMNPCPLTTVYIAIIERYIIKDYIQCSFFFSFVVFATAKEGEKFDWRRLTEATYSKG